MTFDQFIAKWNGLKADYDKAYGGECVDLYNFYMQDVFHLDPYRFGGVNGAKDLAINLPKYKELVWTANNPADASQVPPRGAIVIFGPGLGTYGHVGMATEASANKLVLFDQIGSEDPAKEQPSTTRDHTSWWKYVTGWAVLKPKEAPVNTTSTVDLGIARVISHGVAGRNGFDGRKNSLAGERDDDLNKNHVGAETNTDIWSWYNSPEGKNYREVILPAVYKERDDLRVTTATQKTQIEILTKQVETLKAQVGDNTKWETFKALIRELFNFTKG